MCTSAEVKGEEKRENMTVSKREIFVVSVNILWKGEKKKMGAVFDILHPSFKSALQRADEYLPADMCLKPRHGARRVAGRAEWGGRKAAASEPRWKLELLEKKKTLRYLTGLEADWHQRIKLKHGCVHTGVKTEKNRPRPTIKAFPSQWCLTHCRHIKCIYPPLRAHEYQSHCNYINCALLQMKKWLHFCTKFNFSRHNICQGNQVRFHLTN